MTIKSVRFDLSKNQTHFFETFQPKEPTLEESLEETSSTLKKNLSSLMNLSQTYERDKLSYSIAEDEQFYNTLLKRKVCLIQNKATFGKLLSVDSYAVVHVKVKEILSEFDNTIELIQLICSRMQFVSQVKKRYSEGGSIKAIPLSHLLDISSTEYPQQIFSRPHTV